MVIGSVTSKYKRGKEVKMEGDTKPTNRVRGRGDEPRGKDGEGEGHPGAQASV